MYKYLTVCKQTSSSSFKNAIYKLYAYKLYTPLDKNIRPLSGRASSMWRRMDFQQDNATFHNASVTKKYLLEQKIRHLDHPTCSADLNPIKKNLSGLIVAKVYEGGRQNSAISELKKANLDAWEKIPSAQLQKLVDSMPSRIFEVIKANGGSTKY